MLTKSILIAFLAAFGVVSSPEVSPEASPKTNPEASPPEKQPPEDFQEHQYFCCTSVDLKTFTGEGCTAINNEKINTCANVLYCPNMWARSEGKVACG